MNCPRCGAAIQISYVRCARCGLEFRQPPPVQQPAYRLTPYPPQIGARKPLHAKWWFWTLLVFGVLFMFVIALVSTSMSSSSRLTENISEAEYRSICSTDIEYESLMRNPDDYFGEKYCVQLKISQVIKNGSKIYYRCYTNDEYDWWLGDEYYIEDAREESTKILEDDIINVYGEFAGLEIVNRIIGTSDEVPKIVMRYCDLLQMDE